jgi:hypothetical protein
MVRRVRLGTKLVAVFLAAGLLPMLATCLYNYLQTQAAFKERALNENSLYVEQKARILQDWMAQKASEVQMMLRIPVLYESVYAISLMQGDMGNAVFTMKYMALERLLVNFMVDFIKEKGYSNAAVVKMDGTVIYDSTKGERSGEGRSIADRPYFKEASQGKVAPSPIFQSPLLNEPVMALAGPVLKEGDKGELIGVFLVTLPSKKLLLEQGVKKGKADFSGVIVASDKEGRKLLTSYAVLKTGENFYGLLAEQEGSQAMAQLVGMRNVSLFGVAPAALLAGMCGFFVARSIAGPLQISASPTTPRTQPAKG